jgi:hypothetical protein
LNREERERIAIISPQGTIRLGAPARLNIQRVPKPGEPLRIGVNRPLPDLGPAWLTETLTVQGGQVFIIPIVSDGARYLRLRFADFDVPPEQKSSYLPSPSPPRCTDRLLHVAQTAMADSGPRLLSVTKR